MLDEGEKWSVNETLLQSYRSIFISSQSFMLAVGAVMWDKNDLLLLIIAVISLGMIWFIWFGVARSRHLIVDYYKYRSDLPDSETKKNLCSEKEYVKNRELRKKANEIFRISRDQERIKNWRRTRIKVDLITPVLFSIVWFVLVLGREKYLTYLINCLRTCVCS